MALSARSRAWSAGAGTTVAGRVLVRLASRLRGLCTAWWHRTARSRALPAELRAALPLSRGERILAIGRHPDGSYTLAATDRALHYRAGAGGWSRLGWELITAAAWDERAGRLVITGLAGFAPARTVLPLRDRGALPELAEERITHTWLGCWTVTLSDRRRVLVEVRRRPRTDELLWAIVAGNGDGAISGDRDVRAQVDRAVIRLGEHLGLTSSPP